MVRKDEAILSQTYITFGKTIFVEGNLDYRIMRDFLKSQNIANVKVIEIGAFINDSDVPIEMREIAKEKVKKLIIKSNAEEKIKGKYMGIVDLDYDYFNNCAESIDNLSYTDYNSIESYFLDIDLINEFLEEHNINVLSNDEFLKWIDNTLLFSCYFYFQLCNITNIDKEDHLSFSDLNISNSAFTDFGRKKILLKNILKYKTKNYPSTLPPFFKFLKQLDRNKYSELRLMFLHGKHTLRYVIGILKSIFEEVRHFRNEHIVFFLKDKFLMYDYYSKYQLFKTVVLFANT